MYSRKYIRSPAAFTPQAERISPSTGISLPIPSGREERGVALPPDYTGMAFSGGGNPSSLQNPEDYPETLIPPVEEERSSQESGDSALLPAEEVETGQRISHSPAGSELSMPSMEEGAVLITKEEPLPLAEEESPPPPTKTEAEKPTPPPRPEAVREPSPPAASMPLLTTEWLRSLTLEDLLLFWMLLMLTVSSQEDQIYLLLGLLLFHH